MRGCNVLTRPSMISGKPVYEDTSRTGSPCSASSFAVPPVESISTRRFASPRARSRSPVLSETESSARRTPIHGESATKHSARETVQPKLLAERAAIDPENVRRTDLIALGVGEHGAQQRLLHFAQHEIVQARRAVSVQARKIFAEGALRVGAQWQLLAVRLRSGIAASFAVSLRGHVRLPLWRRTVRMRPGGRIDGLPTAVIIRAPGSCASWNSRHDFDMARVAAQCADRVCSAACC